ncbi:MAG TPA: hypothetical protein VMB20_04590 [Candidatus Acidoferrum sp.]|nr:hypothetical protein [Candidatus Acidoferrum sp.]
MNAPQLDGIRPTRTVWLAVALVVTLISALAPRVADAGHRGITFTNKSPDAFFVIGAAAYQKIAQSDVPDNMDPAPQPPPRRFEECIRPGRSYTLWLPQDYQPFDMPAAVKASGCNGTVMFTRRLSTSRQQTYMLEKTAKGSYEIVPR